MVAGLSTFNSLKGPANDLKLTKGVLRERFGFVEHDFIILKDEKATHTGIENAFNALRERVKPNDFVYIFYSGPGSQTKDLNGDERSGYDQTWVSYAARTRSLSFSWHNQSQKDYYCYLIHIDPNDDIHTIFPDNTESAHLKKGEKRKVRSLLLMDESGDNTILIITSTDQMDISLLELPTARSDSNDEWATGQVSFKVIRQ